MDLSNETLQFLISNQDTCSGSYTSQNCLRLLRERIIGSEALCCNNVGHDVKVKEVLSRNNSNDPRCSITASAGSLEGRRRKTSSTSNNVDLGGLVTFEQCAISWQFIFDRQQYRCHDCERHKGGEQTESQHHSAATMQRRQKRRRILSWTDERTA